MDTLQKALSQKTIFKIACLWIPILLWWLLVYAFRHSDHFLMHVDSIYYQAAQNWLSAKALYNGQGTYGFVYLPTMAAVFSPFTLLPLKYFVIFFRLLSIAAITMGLIAFTNAFETDKPKQYFFSSLLCTVIISQAALFQGQLHIITTGTLLLGYAALAKGKWWQSAIWLTISLALKPTSIVLYLLALSLYPKLSWRIVLTTAICFGLSFLAQSPHYAATQYHAFIGNFIVGMHADATHTTFWPNIFGMINFYTGYHISGANAFYLRILFAGLTFLICLFSRIKLSKEQAAFFIFTLGMCYLMLFNSRTENNNYIMIAPSIGFFLAMAIEAKKTIEILGLSLLIIILAASWSLCKWLTPGNTAWLNPSVAFILSIYTISKMTLKKQAPLQ